MAHLVEAYTENSRRNPYRHNLRHHPHRCLRHPHTPFPDRCIDVRICFGIVTVGAGISCAAEEQQCGENADVMKYLW